MMENGGRVGVTPLFRKEFEHGSEKRISRSWDNNNNEPAVPIGV